MRIETLSVREAREQLPKLLERFRSGDRTPVGIGSHRRTEAIVMAVEVYDELTAERHHAARQAAASLRVEGLTPSIDVEVITERWIHGEITTAEMRKQVKELYGVR